MRPIPRLRLAASFVLMVGLPSPSDPPTPAVAEQPGARMSPGTIAFASRRDGNWELYTTDVDGAHQTRLTRRSSDERFPLWSPDRTRIVFGSMAGQDWAAWELWVMNADGSD